MKRAALATAWILGTTLPLLAATVFLFGCCVLPFHQVMHKLMPICELAMSVMRGGEGEDHDATPARQREEPVKRIATSMPKTFRLTMSPASAARFAPASEISFRSFVSLGAVRCDQDVGLHVLVETFRI